MKIRNHRKREWRFWPPKNSKLCKGSCYIFKYKKDLLKFIGNNFNDAVNGTVSIDEKTFNASYTVREFFVWYNEREYKNGGNFKVVFKQILFRGKKFVCKKHKISKESKKYFAFSKKVVSLMCRIAEQGIDRQKAEKLVELFKKRGFKDWEANEEDQRYINGHIGDGIDFYHWSDRCGDIRMKTVIEYFKKENLI